eukprot:CAMPEP_0178461062 /NCGR_PEP_ID=MMETSP0689_2-20121128/49086_1 /TAXON_ID=160604 /ORGANISM="Amphidinium massartii, Strain CS-259" /LENGTH=43 /DNA_ID= /DNA_START= /DNA_END= /DNA_ORIENTATION=
MACQTRGALPHAATLTPRHAASLPKAAKALLQAQGNRNPCTAD